MDADTRTEVRTARCAEHGTVRAQREMPRPQWPFIVYFVKRARAKRAPFICPDCGQPVDEIEKS